MRTRFLAAAALALALAACTDGYPNTDAPTPDLIRLDQPGRLQALNEAAAAAASDVDWRFRLRPDCTLHAERRRLFGVDELFVLPLSGADPQLRASDGARRFELVATAADGRELSVFATRSRVDALRAELALKLLRRDCRPEGRAGAAAYNPRG